MGGLGWGDGRVWEGGYRIEGIEVLFVLNYLLGEIKDTGLFFKRCLGEGLFFLNYF